MAAWEAPGPQAVQGLPRGMELANVPDLNFTTAAVSNPDDRPTSKDLET